MSLTITIPGAVDVTTGSTAPAVLTIGVGVPGATGPAGPTGATGPQGVPGEPGPAGPGLPAGGEDGQIIVKDGTVDYATIWTDNSAETLTVRATNKTGSTLNKGAVVRINGAQGQRPTIALAQGNSGASADGVIGILLATLANNATGLVCTAGLAKRLDTSAYTEGVKLFLSPSVAGGLTPTRPSAPDHAVAVGIVSHSSATTGSIEVNVVVGDHLEWLHDVKITSASNGQVLKYDSAQGLWVNGTDVSGVAWGGITGTLSSQTDLANALNAKLELSGGVLDANATIQASTTTEVSVFGGSGLNVELSANPSENSVLNYGGLQVQNFSGTMAVTPSGLTFPNSSTQTVAYPGSTGFLLKADNLAGLANTGTARTNLGLGTMATATAADYSTTTVADGLYYPLTGNPSSFLVAADIAGKANSADAALTGNVTITTNSTNPALVITQDGTGDVVQFKDVTSDTTYSFINAVGKVTTTASVTTSAPFNIPNGVAPTSNLVNGDFWTTTSGVFTRINGNSVQLADVSSGLTYSGNNTFTGPTVIFGSNSSNTTVAIGNGATVSGSTKNVNIATNGVSGSTTNVNIGTTSGGTNNITVNGPTTFNASIAASGNQISIGTGTAASNFNFGTGVTASGLTKAVAIGTLGAAGSTTTVTIGNTTGSTTTLQGTTNGVTAAADTNSVALATTAYVVGQASASAPSNDAATAAVGTSLRYARADHAHQNPLPTGGTTGQVLAKIDGTDYNTNWITPSGGGGASTDYQAYTTAGTFTWTKPANAKWVEIVMFGGGGGAGSGGRYATTSIRTGGGGGGGGPMLIAKVSASALNPTESVVVGVGGTGGAATSTNTSLGTSGGQGGSSTFSIFTAAGGSGGAGGGNVGSAAGGAAQVGWVTGVSAASATAGGAAPSTNTSGAIGGTASINSYVATGGGSGAGNAANATTSNAGGNGGAKNVATTGTPLVAGGTGGTTAGVAPTTGVAGAGIRGGGSGGGGGAYRTALAGMDGAVGASPGGGGGGGSASDNGFASGAGGNGGVGAVYIITYC